MSSIQWVVLFLSALLASNVRASTFTISGGDNIYANLATTVCIGGLCETWGGDIPNIGSFSSTDYRSPWIQVEVPGEDYYERTAEARLFMDVLSDDVGLHMDTRIDLTTSYGAWDYFGIPAPGLLPADVGYARAYTDDETNYNLYFLLNESSRFVAGNEYKFSIEAQAYGDPWGSANWQVVIPWGMPGAQTINQGNYSEKVVKLVAGEYSLLQLNLGVGSLETVSIGDGSISSGLKISLVPSPVPVPAALPLFLSGLAGIGWLASRRKIMPTQTNA